MGRRRRCSIITALVLAAGLLAPVPSSAAPGDVPQRLAGPDRYATAAAISASRFASGVPVVHVVTGGAFADALVAGVAAGIGRGPVLLTQRDALPPVTVAELERLSPASIVVVGGTSVVSEAVASELATHTDGEVTRRDGANRYETAVAVSRAAFSSAAHVYLASGERFPDALAAVPVAVRAGAPLLLTPPGSLPAATAAELERLGTGRVTILGGEATVSATVESEVRSIVGSVVRVAGENRYATSAALSSAAFADGADRAYLATGRSFADALAAGPVAALAGAPVLLVRTNCVPGRVLDELGRLGAGLVLLGGDRAVGRGIEDRSRCPYSAAVIGSPSVAPTSTPAWNDDGPDPHIVRFGDRWYAYTTGTTWGNHIGVLVSDRPDGGWRTTTGTPYGSTALDGAPSWQVPETQWAPAVYRFGGRFVMFYAAQDRTRGEWCLSVATSSSPAGPFRDRTAGPTICQDHLGGVIDPHPFVDADGTPWLHFKNNDGMDNDGFGNDVVSRVLVTRLAADGTTPVGGFGEVLVKDTSRYPWQTTVDNPQMVVRGGVHYLFHTGGNYVGDDSYAVGYAVCHGPTGPCTTASEPILGSYGDVAGPGGGTVAVDTAGNWWMSYHAWPEGCADYSCGERRLYVAPLTF